LGIVHVPAIHWKLSPLGVYTTAPDQISVVSVPRTPRLNDSGNRRRLCVISRKVGSVNVMGRLRIASQRPANFGSAGATGKPVRREQPFIVHRRGVYTIHIENSCEKVSF